MKNVGIAKSLNNNRGFTLLEVMFTLFVLSVIVFLLPLLIKQVMYHDLVERLNEKEVEIFFMQLSKEIHSALAIQVHDDTLYITHKDGRVASYGRYGANVRRQVNGSGQERALQNIETISFTWIDSVVTISIEGKNELHFERKFALMGEFE